MNYRKRRKPNGTATWAAVLAACVVCVGAGAQEATPETAPSTVTAEGQEAVKVTQPGTFEIHVQGADLRGVLQLLSTQGKKNIVATKEVTGTVTADLYGVTFDQALEAILRSSGFVYELQENFVYIYTPAQLEERRKAARIVATRTFHLAYVTANDIKTLIEPAMSSDGTIAITPAAVVGIATSETDAGGNNLATEDVLVIRDYEENLDAIGEIVRKIDVKPQQVLIEATVLRATLNEENHLGVEFNTLAGINFEALNSSSDGLTNMNTGTVTGGALDNRMATWRTDLNAGVPSGGFSFGLVSNSVSFFVRALETVTDVTVLANPKLLVLNKQRGEVLVGQRDGYITTTFTETTATQSVEFLETGTRLVVRPFVGRDGYVRLEIHPEDSNGSVESVGQFALPRETTTEVTSNVMVRDGHTIVIGGLFRERTQNGRAQVPLVGNIPYVGSLFRRTSDVAFREEVIVLITPRIIKQAADEIVSEQLKDDIERFRIGQRKGLRWWGRNRLAQTYMRWAKQAVTRGELSKALWNLDMALSMSPKMEEAIHLRERLTNKAYWADESRDSVSAYVIQRMVMQELGKPVEDIVFPCKPLHARDVAPQVREDLGIGDRPERPMPVLTPSFGTSSQEVKTPAGESDGRKQPSSARPDMPASEVKKEGVAGPAEERQ